MIAPTHITFAEFIYLLLLTTTGISLSVINSVTIAFASILADVDTAASTVGKVMPFLSTRIERRFGHRTLTHSALFVCALSIICLPLYALHSEIYICFIIGYASHPFLDTMTVTGVKLFYPLSPVKCVFPFEVNNPHRYRVQTGGKIDKMLAILFFIGCIPTFLIAHQGYERFIRTTQRNIEAAVRDYNQFSKDHLVFANITGYTMLTKESLTGRFEVVGALNPRTLIFKGTDGMLHTLGKDFQADYVAEDIVCEKGASAYSKVNNIDLSNQLLSQITSYIDTSIENYFFGDLSTSDKISLPENIKLFSPVSGSSTAIKFNYATYDDIREYNLEYAFITKGIITVKSILRKGSETYQSSETPSHHENYAQFSLTINAKETITFLKEKGDTVREKEVIARRDLAQFFEEQINLNDDKIQILVNQESASLLDINQKISAAEQSVKIDSVEHGNNLELTKGGFVTKAVLDISRLKLQKDKRVLSELVSSRNATVDKTSHEIRKLRLSIQQLRAKQRAAEMQADIRSTATGVLVDVRQHQQNNKLQITFIIKRIP